MEAHLLKLFSKCQALRQGGAGLLVTAMQTALLPAEGTLGLLSQQLPSLGGGFARKGGTSEFAALAVGWKMVLKGSGWSTRSD